MAEGLFQVGDGVLKSVVSLLNYSSLKSFEEDVEKIREWMKMQPHFPEVMEAKKVQNFLILNKGSVEITKEKIDNYYTMRSQLPQFFDESNPKLPYMEKNYHAFYFIPLPKLTKDMYRVFFFKIRDTNMKEIFNPIHVIRYMLNIQEIRLMEDITHGDVFVIDGKNAPLNFVLNITPTIIYTLLIVVYKRVYSNRLKAVHIIHAPSFAEKFIAILKTMMGAKVMKRIHFHGSYDVVTQEFGKEIIPRDLGGEEKSVDELQNMVVEKFEEYSEVFDGLDQLRVCEKLRPGKIRDESLSGLQGNFKKLEVD